MEQNFLTITVFSILQIWLKRSVDSVLYPNLHKISCISSALVCLVRKRLGQVVWLSKSNTLELNNTLKPSKRILPPSWQASWVGLLADELVASAAFPKGPAFGPKESISMKPNCTSPWVTWSQPNTLKISGETGVIMPSLSHILKPMYIHCSTKAQSKQTLLSKCFLLLNMKKMRH